MFKFSFQLTELNENFQTSVIPNKKPKVESSNNDTNEEETITSSTKSTADDEASITTTTTVKAIPCLPFEEIHPTKEQLSKSMNEIKCGIMIFASGVEILHLKCDGLIKDVVESQIIKKRLEEKESLTDETKTSSRNDCHSTDLIPGVYEGGGKIWECTQDLGDYLTKNIDDNEKSSIFSQISGEYILDLGCGAGILGLLALLSGANVHFQDYNREILSKITIPNAILNCDEQDNKRRHLQRCKFYAGDWSNYIKATEYDGSPMFDIILTSETIYNPTNMAKILNVFKRKLKRPNGVAYLAAKTYYFGVGGGIRAFESLVAEDGTLCTEVVWKTNENVQREILKITRKLQK